MTLPEYLSHLEKLTNTATPDEDAIARLANFYAHKWPGDVSARKRRARHYTNGYKEAILDLDPRRSPVPKLVALVREMDKALHKFQAQNRNRGYPTGLEWMGVMAEVGKSLANCEKILEEMVHD